MLEATSNYKTSQPAEELGLETLVPTDQTAVWNRHHEKNLIFEKISLVDFAYASFTVASPWNLRAMLPRLSRAPVGLPPGYKLLPQEAVFLCCISQGTRLFPKAVPPTYLPNLTYLPATLFTINHITSISIFSHSYIHFCTQAFYPISWIAFSKLSIQHFPPSSMLCVFLFYFSSFPHFPIHSVYCFHFSSHFPCGLFNPIVWTLVTLYLFAFLA